MNKLDSQIHKKRINRSYQQISHEPWNERLIYRSFTTQVQPIAPWPSSNRQGIELERFVRLQSDAELLQN